MRFLWAVFLAFAFDTYAIDPLDFAYDAPPVLQDAFDGVAVVAFAPYLSKGKRSIITEEYRAQFAKWAKHFRVPAPDVRVRAIGRASYRFEAHRIGLPPGCHVATLVHEFAHHLAFMRTRHKGHGAPYRVALVEVASYAMGGADRYPWVSEYAKVNAWAKRHGFEERTA